MLKRIAFSLAIALIGLTATSCATGGKHHDDDDCCGKTCAECCKGGKCTAECCKDGMCAKCCTSAPGKGEDAAKSEAATCPAEGKDSCCSK